MRFIRNLLVGSIFAAFSAGMASAAPVSSLQTNVQQGPGLVLKVQNRCENLRRSCERKGQLGERGEGNCRQYREECGYQRSASYCARLRRECLNREERGERGEGNCRRFREECRQG
jgi:hypothetical protein